MASKAPFFRRTLTTVAAAAAITGAATQTAAADLPIGGGPAELTRTYRGQDGSALYTRAVGSKVVGFGEDGTGKQAFVFEGARSGIHISGRWWDVAKGTRAQKGDLELTFSDGGSTLTRSGGDDLGPDSWQAKSAEEMTYPKRREAGFQSIASDDLDGAFAADDRARAYVRQPNSTDVAMVVERWVSESYTRPKYATVVIGTRAGDGTLTGTYYDVPKGVTLQTGTLTGKVDTQPRRFQLDYAGATDRATAFEADYAVDIKRFGQEIENRLGPFVVGFGYAIAADDKVVLSGAGGSRRIPQPTNDLTELPYTASTYHEVASTSKVVTLAAVARALHERGLTLDAKVAPYLPPAWPRDPSMETVTFRTILSHGGLKHPGSICQTDPYACLQQAVAAGMTAPAAYNNIHYTLMRVVLPAITHPEQMKNLFATETDTAKLNAGFSALFREDIHTVLELAGVKADFAYPYSATAAYGYTWGTPPTNEVAPTGSDDDYLMAGSGGLKMTPIQYAQWLNRLENGWIVDPDTLDEMKAMGFGQTSATATPGTGIGPLCGKAGGVGGMMGSYAMVFPGNVQVFTNRNSTGNTNQIADNAMLRNAWVAALVNASS